MTPEGRIFENSVEKGKPFDIRVVSGDADSPASTIAGLNEGAHCLRSCKHGEHAVCSCLRKHAASMLARFALAPPA